LEENILNLRIHTHSFQFNFITSDIIRRLEIQCKDYFRNSCNDSVFCYILASILFCIFSSSIHKSVKLLSRIKWTINAWPFRMKIKIFWKISSNRKIGFTIGSLAVMTFPFFYKVSILRKWVFRIFKFELRNCNYVFRWWLCISDIIYSFTKWRKNTDKSID